MSVRPAKTQISLGIRPVWSESSLSAWRKLGSLANHWADAQAGLSLHWAHIHFVGFVTSRLISSIVNRKNALLSSVIELTNKKWVERNTKITGLHPIKGALANPEDQDEEDAALSVSCMKETYMNFCKTRIK